MPNTHSAHWPLKNRSVQTASKLRGNSARCQGFGKKPKIPSFPPPCFIASPSTDLIWQPLLHGSQTHRPPRLRSKGPWWLLGALSVVRYWRGLASWAVSPVPCPWDWHGKAGGLCCLWDVHSLCQRSGAPGQWPKGERQHMWRGQLPSPTAAGLEEPPAQRAWQCNPCAHSPMNGHGTGEGCC